MDFNKQGGKTKMTSVIKASLIGGAATVLGAVITGYFSYGAGNEKANYCLL